MNKTFVLSALALVSVLTLTGCNPDVMELLTSGTDTISGLLGQVTDFITGLLGGTV